jgi:hypothetical protein
MTTKIKAIHIFQHFDDGSDPLIALSYEYDKEGRLILEAEYNDGELINSTALQYDKGGHITEELHIFAMDGIEQKNIYIRDDHGKITQAEIHYADGSVSTRKYSREGSVETIVITNENNEIEGTEIRVYDAADRLISETHQDEKKNVVKQVNNEYDERGLKIKASLKSENEMDNAEQVMTYDEKERLTMKKTSDQKGSLIRKIVIEYNDDDSVDKEYVESYEYNTVKFFNQYSYDDSGHLVKEERIYANGTVDYKQTFEYENDRLSREVRIDNGRMTEKSYQYEFFS